MFLRVLVVASLVLTVGAVRQVAVDEARQIQKHKQVGTEGNEGAVVSEGFRRKSDMLLFVTEDDKVALVRDFNTADRDGDHVLGFSDVGFLEKSDAAKTESQLKAYGTLVKVGGNAEDPHDIGMSFNDFVYKLYKGPVAAYRKIQKVSPNEGELTIGKVIQWLQELCANEAVPGSSYDYATNILKTTYGYRAATWNADSSEVMTVAQFQEIYDKKHWVSIFSKYSSGDNGELTYDDFDKASVALGVVEAQEEEYDKDLERFEKSIGKNGRRILGGLMGIKSAASEHRAAVKEQMKMMGRKSGESGEKVVTFHAFVNFFFDRNANLALSKGVFAGASHVVDYDESKWYIGREV